MLLGHITDLHVAREEDYRSPAEASWIPRVRKHSIEILRRMLEDLAYHRPDHVVVTGDLTQTSKREEFRACARILEETLGEIPITILPGNHDRWRREAVEGGHFEADFGRWLQSDLPGEGFPICHLRDEVAIVALDSSPFSTEVPPAEVAGHVSEAQLERLVEWAQRPELRDRFLVVALHHHLRLSEEDARALDPKDDNPLLNAAEVEEVLAQLPVDLVLHGHRHRQMRLDLNLGGRNVPVLCPGSGSRADPRVERTAKYGLYRIQERRLESVRFRAWDPFAERVEEFTGA